MDRSCLFPFTLQCACNRMSEYESSLLPKMRTELNESLFLFCIDQLKFPLNAKVQGCLCQGASASTNTQSIAIKNCFLKWLQAID